MKKAKPDKNPKLSNTILLIGIVLLIMGIIIAFQHDWTPREEIIRPNYDIHPIRAFEDSYHNDTWQFVDIRLPEEFLIGHVKNSTNVNFHNESTFYNEIESLEKGDKIYVVYDNDGSNNSIYVVEYMINMGHTKVYNLQGGFMKWKESGIPWMINGDL